MCYNVFLRTYYFSSLGFFSSLGSMKMSSTTDQSFYGIIYAQRQCLKHMIAGCTCPPACSLSRVQLFVTLLDCSPPGFCVHGISQAGILEWVAIPPPGDLPDPGFEPTSPGTPSLQADSLPLRHQGNPVVYYKHLNKSSFIFIKFWPFLAACETYQSRN